MLMATSGNAIANDITMLGCLWIKANKRERRLSVKLVAC